MCKRTNQNTCNMLKIRIMMPSIITDLKLNIWQTRGLTLLAKTMGVSQLIYVAAMLSVPKNVIQKRSLNFLLSCGRTKMVKLKGMLPINQF